MLAYYDCDGGTMNFWERGINNQNAESNQDKPANQSQNKTPNNHNFDVMVEIARLNSLSEAERMSELMKTAGKMRAEGNLSGGDLERIYKTASMFMTEEQLSRLRALIDMVK